MDTMRFGVGLIGEHPPPRMIELVELIERLGFDQIWLTDERFHRDVYVNMTIAACHSQSLGIGCMVTDPYVRHPALTAVAAATVDELSGNRCTLGIGAGISGFKEMGMERTRPARAIKETVQLIRRLSRGEQDVSFEGDIIRFDGGGLDFTPPRPVRMLVGGRGPRVLEVAGEVGDAVLVGSFASPRAVGWALDHVKKGAARVGRDPQAIPKVSWLYTSVSPDPEAARNAVRVGVAVAMSGSFNILDKIGANLPGEVTDFMNERGYRFDREQLSELGALLPEEMLGDFSVAGTVDEVVAKLTAIGRLGIGEAALWPFPPEGSRMEETLELLSKEVIPAVRAALGS